MNSMSITARLGALGITLPAAPRPVGAYVPALRCGDLVWTSGQLPMVDGRLIAVGKVPQAVDLEQARAAARAAVLNGLAAVTTVLDPAEDIVRVIRLGVFVNSAAGFCEQAQVANGASDLLLAVFNDAGRHVRAAVGVNELPLNAAVELELLVAVR